MNYTALTGVENQLHIAAALGNQAFFRHFWDQPGLVNNLSPRDHDGLTPFLVAVRAGQIPLMLDFFKYLPAEHTKLRTPLGFSALHLACQSGFESVVDFLLKKGFDTDSTTNDMSTALHLAIATESTKPFGIINSLLDFGASPLTPDPRGDYPIHTLSRVYNMKDDLKLLERMLDTSIGCENVGDRLGNTPLHNACLAGWVTDPKILKLYLVHGYDLFKENYGGQSSFQILLGRPSGPPPRPGSFGRNESGHFIEFVLECASKEFLGVLPGQIRTSIIKALISSIEQKYWNISRKLLNYIDELRKEYAPNDPEPIHVAAINFCDYEVFQILVDKTRDLTTYDSAGKTPLHLAAGRFDLLKVQAIVGKSPRSINQLSIDRSKTTPVLSADMSRFYGQQVVQYLIAQGADISIRNAFGLSVIHSACLHGCVNILKILTIRQLKNAGNANHTVNGTAWWGIGCIHFASFRFNTNLMEYLLDEVGFDVDEASTRDSMTPLHISAFTGNYTMTKFLLQRKATIDKPNAAGETPLNLAFRIQDPEIAQLIINADAKISLDADSIASLEVMTYGKPEQSTIFKNALKFRGKSIQGSKQLQRIKCGLGANFQILVSLTDILSRMDLVNLSADDEKKLRLALKRAIETRNEDLCDEITSKNLDFSEPIDDCGRCSPLIYALRLRVFGVARMFVRKGIGIDDITCDRHRTAGFDALHYAANGGDEELIRLLFKQGYTVTQHPVHAIHIAAAQSHLSCIAAILKYYNSNELFAEPYSLAQVNTPQTRIENQIITSQAVQRIIDTKIGCIPTRWPWDYCGYKKNGGPEKLWTALHIAVCNNDIPIIDLLLGSGANPNSPDAQGCTALHIAAENGFLDSISKLLECGADPSLEIKSSKFTPLCCALNDWQPEAAELLLTPQSVRSLMKGGKSVLHKAIPLMDKEFIIKVLSFGLDINIADDHGWTSYHVACDLEMEDDALQMVQFLHSHGADVNACTSVGSQPITIAIEHGHVKLCQQLVDLGAVILHTPDRFHLRVAMEYGHTEVSKWLVSNYPAVQTVRDMDGCLPCHYMVVSDNHEMHNYGLEICTSFDFDCYECGSLLNKACRWRRLYLVKKVMEQLQPDEFRQLCQKSSKRYSPPLITAIINCSVECVEALLDEDTDIEIKTEDWDNPLITACKYGRTEIVKLLIKRGAKLFQTNKDGNLVSAIEAAKDHKTLKTWLEENVSEFGNELPSKPEGLGDSEGVSLANLALEC